MLTIQPVTMWLLFASKYVLMSNQFKETEWKSAPQNYSSFPFKHNLFFFFLKEISERLKLVLK